MQESMHVKSLKSIPLAKSETSTFLVEERSHKHVPGKTRTFISFNVNYPLEQNLLDVSQFQILFKIKMYCCLDIFS